VEHILPCADSFSFLCRAPPLSPLFPYTTLFRSQTRGMTFTIHNRGQNPEIFTTGDHAAFDRSWPEFMQHDPTGYLYYGHLEHVRSEEHTSELQSRFDLVCRLLLEKKKHASQNSS